MLWNFLQLFNRYDCSFLVNLNSFKQFIQNLGSYRWKNVYIWEILFLFASSIKTVEVGSILKNDLKRSNLLGDLTDFLNIYAFQVYSPCWLQPLFTKTTSSSLSWITSTESYCDKIVCFKVSKSRYNVQENYVILSLTLKFERVGNFEFV